MTPKIESILELIENQIEPLTADQIITLSKKLKELFKKKAKEIIDREIT